MSLAREVQVKFRMTRQERELLEEKMALAGTVNMGAYLRKMAIDGYVLRLDLPGDDLPAPALQRQPESDCQTGQRIGAHLRNGFSGNSGTTERALEHGQRNSACAERKEMSEDTLISKETYHSFF